MTFDATRNLGVYEGGQCGSFRDYFAISYNGNKIITGSVDGCLNRDNQKSVDFSRVVTAKIA